jgi:hypothetical protein
MLAPINVDSLKKLYKEEMASHRKKRKEGVRIGFLLCFISLAWWYALTLSFPLIPHPSSSHRARRALLVMPPQTRILMTCPAFWTSSMKQSETQNPRTPRPKESGPKFPKKSRETSVSSRREF